MSVIIVDLVVLCVLFFFLHSAIPPSSHVLDPAYSTVWPLIGASV